MMRKAGAAILLLCMAFVTAEIKGAGNGLFEKLKLLPPAVKDGHAPTLEAQTGYPHPNNAQTWQHDATTTDSQMVQTAPQEDTNASSVQTNYSQSLETLNFHEGDFDWRQDWWKALLCTLGALVAVAILMKIAKQLIRYIIMLACLAAGSFGARFFGPPLAPWLETKLPSFLVDIIPAIYWSYLLTFLVCYIFATIVLCILKGPLNVIDKNNNHSGEK